MSTTTVLALAIISLSLTTVRADSLEGEELEAYNAYCPPGDQRAVWAEPLPGIFTGWLKLVCLDEDEQQTSSWYVTPEGEVVHPDEAELPVYVRPMVAPDTLISIDELSDEDTMSFWLDFVYEEPTVPSLEFYGAPEGIAGSSGSSTTGPNGTTVSSYQLNGRTVTEAEYELWQSSYLAASRAQNAERDRLVHEQVQLALYDLVELNQWHHLIDVDAVNNGYGDEPFWQFNSSLVITLTGKQVRDLIQSSEGLVYISSYRDWVTSTDGGEGTTGELISTTADLPTASSEQPTEGEIIPSENQNTLEDSASNASSTGGSASGSMHPVSLLVMLFTLGLTIRRSGVRMNFC